MVLRAPFAVVARLGWQVFVPQVEIDSQLVAEIVVVELGVVETELAAIVVGYLVVVEPVLVARELLAVVVAKVALVR